MQTRGHPWYNGSMLNCWSTGQVMDHVPGGSFITKFISLAQVAPTQYSLRSAESRPKTPFISSAIPPIFKNFSATWSQFPTKACESTKSLAKYPVCIIYGFPKAVH